MLIAATVLIYSCDEDNPLGIVTCPNESLEPPTITDTLAYSIYNRVLTTYYSSSNVAFGHVLQRTDDGLRSQEVEDKMNSIGVPYDTAALEDFFNNNPIFEHEVLENTSLQISTHLPTMKTNVWMLMRNTIRSIQIVPIELSLPFPVTMLIHL